MKMDEVESVIADYVKKSKLVAHQITSFNDLINNGLQQVILQHPDVTLPNDVRINFGEVYVDYPQYTISNRSVKKMYPMDARNGQGTYDANILVNITITLPNGDVFVHNRVAIGKLPIMVGSCRCNLNATNTIEKLECLNDAGGYFIIGGKEKVLVCQLRPAYNKVYVYKCNDKYAYVAEMRTIGPDTKSFLIKAMIDRQYNLLLSVPYIKENLSPGLIFRAMGISHEELDTVLYHIPSPYAVENIQRQYEEYTSVDEALQEVCKYISEKDPTIVGSILKNEMFCHLGHQTPLKNSMHLGYIMKKLVETMNGTRTCDDKDSLINKRLDTPNNLITFIFRPLYKQMLKNLAMNVSLRKGVSNMPKEPNYIDIIKASSTITANIKACFTKSRWDTQKSAHSREGVSQMLSRQNYGAFLSHLRRMMLPVVNRGKIINMRQLAASHYGFICPYETPEGQQVGTVLNMALTTEVTIETPPMDVLEVIKRMETFTDNPVVYRVLVLLNGVIIGSAADSLQFYREFYALRASDAIQDTVSIARLKFEKEIHIWCDQGRFIRPLFQIEHNKLLFKKGMTWTEAIANHSIVFRDPFEIEQSVIAPDKTALQQNMCDYMEIHPVLMMGLMAAVIPFSNNSQSPRLAYQSCMGKQAQGIPALNYQSRWDTTLHALDTPQKPLTQSKIVNIVGFNDMSHGCMPIVAIMSFSGFNQEDGFILNKASLDRGLFHCTTYRTITEEAKRRGNSDYECICMPKAEYRKREYNYEHIGQDGLIRKPEKGGSLQIRKGDVLIGKTLSKVIKVDGDKREFKTVDISIVAKQNEEGYLDDVCDSMTPEGVRVVKVRIRIPRRPEIGDKFASSCAQKGTCGMIFSQEDLPVDRNGISPDLIMNPHAIPSRMTINMLIEMGYNLICAETGQRFDATAFENDNIAKDLKTLIGDCSFAKTMFCGLTGRKLSTKVFMAPSMFQRLKHMVGDKFHARRCGPLDTLTHQPVAGRAKDGGLKCGEMERDSLIVHGCSEFLNETMFIKSDKYHVAVCKTCGQIPPNLTSCGICKDDNVEIKNMPYAGKLLFQLAMGMGLKVKIG